PGLSLAHRPTRDGGRCRDRGPTGRVARGGLRVRTGPVLLGAPRAGRGAGIHREGKDRGKERAMRPTRTLGFQLLGVWLVVNGIVGLGPGLSIPGVGFVMALLALVTGLLILLGRA